MKTPKRKAATRGQSRAAANSPNEITKAREREYYDLSTFLLGKLKIVERQAFDRYRISQSTEDASVWLNATHQLRQVARDIKYGGSRLDETEVTQ
jgi:hypothetical protein